MKARRNTIDPTRREDFGLLVTVLVLTVLSLVGQIECYNGRPSHSSQPKAGIKYLLREN